MGSEPRTVLAALLERYPGASRRTLASWIKAGRVAIDGEPARALKQPIAAGARVSLDKKREEPLAHLHPLMLVHEDADVLIVDKPAGMLTATNARERRATALKHVQRHCEAQGARGFLVHRLDRDVSGLLVFARNAKARDALKGTFASHSIERVYVARLRGRPKERYGTIEMALIERADGTVRRAQELEKGEYAISHYEVIARDGDADCFAMVKLETGRKHQIRAHLAAIGHPLRDDPLYDDRAAPGGRMLLRAMVLGFDQPRTKRRLRFVAEWTKDFPEAARKGFAELQSRAREND